MLIQSREELLEYISQENEVEYLFFWGHQSNKNKITKSCLSQWFESSFIVNDLIYATAEHFMMYQKAILFGDMTVANKILTATTPNDAKKLGRDISNFDDEIWNKYRFDIVVQANLHKFSQHSELNSFLLSTNDLILVEASPVDKIWGIGIAADHPDAKNPIKWQGLNLLGYALMVVREKLRANL